MGQGFFESDEDYDTRMKDEANEQVIKESTGEKPSRGWFESEESYSERIHVEASEQIVKTLTGEAPKQGFFEGDDHYRERLYDEANRQVIRSTTGGAPKQGFFEGDDHYRERLRDEADEQIVARSTGKVPKQRFFETKDDFRSRLHKEAHERRIADATGKAPKRGWIESKGEYRRRISLEARAVRGRTEPTLESVQPLPSHEVGGQGACEDGTSFGDCLPSRASYASLRRVGDPDRSRVGFAILAVVGFVVALIFFQAIRETSAHQDVSQLNGSSSPHSPDGPLVTQGLRLQSITVCQGTVNESDGSCTSDDASPQLVAVCSYSNASAGSTTMDAEWFRDGKRLARSSPLVIRYEAGRYFDHFNSPDLAPGMYKVVVHAGAKIFARGGILVGSRQTGIPLSAPQVSENTYQWGPPVVHPHENRDSQPSWPSFEAVHKHALGGCSGKLLLRIDEIRFLSGTHPLALRRAEIVAADGDGIRDNRGHRWHFRIEGKTGDEVHQLFVQWLSLSQ